MSENNGVGTASEYLMSDWTLAGVPGRSYSALATWAPGNVQVIATDNRSGQAHLLLIQFPEPRYANPAHETIQIGFASTPGEVSVQYWSGSTGDPEQPPEAWFVCFEGEMNVNVEFDPVARTGRTYGSFHGNAWDTSDEEQKIYVLEGTFHVVYPRSGRTPMLGVPGKPRSWLRRLFNQQ